MFPTFSDRIIKWYAENKRDLPWRNTNDAYIIWLSEIILQQTRVEQGTPYFNRFVNQYPSVVDLANAPIDEVLKLWQGLGYYSRARNLHETAKLIKLKFNGVFPEEFKEIITLKGIGNYTASAIASFAFNQPYPVVDGNVMRIITRIFGIYTPIDSNKGKNEIYQILNKLIDIKNPATFNQAIMEFGALQCTPSKPACNICIFKNECFSFNNNATDTFPVKNKKTKIRERFFNYLIFFYKYDNCNYIYLNKRTSKDIWNGLYDFPLIESDELIDFGHLISTKKWKEIIAKNNTELIEISKFYKHQLTHQLIIARFFSFNISEKLHLKKSNSFILIEMNDFKKYAVPKLIDKFYSDYIKKPQV